MAGISLIMKLYWFEYESRWIPAGSVWHWSTETVTGLWQWLLRIFRRMMHGCDGAVDGEENPYWSLRGWSDKIKMFSSLCFHYFAIWTSRHTHIVQTRAIPHFVRLDAYYKICLISKRLYSVQFFYLRTFMHSEKEVFISKVGDQATLDARR
jgi:hypothetical protein